MIVPDTQTKFWRQFGGSSKACNG